jgi:DNA-binding NarL/FixJ family response regulator
MTGPAQTDIVIADACRLHAEALALALTAHGFQVRAIAVTPEEAVEAVAETAPELCLMEGGLLDGEAAESIQLLHARGPRTRIVVLARHMDPGVAEAVAEAGAAGCLRGDLSIEALTAELRRLASGGPFTEPATAPEALRRRRGPGGREERDRRLRWLTPREREVLRRLTEGDDTAAIAHALGMTANTARTHIQNVLDKLGVHSRLEAIALANSLGAGRRRKGT